MNKGPIGLPKPRYFLPEVESAWQSYLFYRGNLKFRDSPILWTICVPLIAILGAIRISVLWTNRPPEWPRYISDQCLVGSLDAFDEPSGDTYIGWGQSGPRDSARIEDWCGEPNAVKNCYIWYEDKMDKEGLIRASKKFDQSTRIHVAKGKAA